MPTLESPGILCLESAQAADSPASIRALIGLIGNGRALNFHYQKVQSPAHLRRLLKHWSRPKLRKLFPVLFLSFHGDEKEICIGNKEISLSEISQWLASDSSGGFIHFSSCFTLRGSEAMLSRLLERSGIFGVSGYSRAVDEFESLAIETMLFAKFFEYARINGRIYAEAVKGVHWNAPNLVLNTGFRAFLRD